MNTRNIGHRFPYSGIGADGHPYSCSFADWDGPKGQDDALLDDLSPLEQEIALLWVRECLRPRKTINKMHTSYGIKHWLEHDTKIYMTNNMFKDLLLREGYKHSNEHDINWTYAISESSPTLSLRAVRADRGEWLEKQHPDLARKLDDEYSERSRRLEEARVTNKKNNH